MGHCASHWQYQSLSFLISLVIPGMVNPSWYFFKVATPTCLPRVYIHAQVYAWKLEADTGGLLNHSPLYLLRWGWSLTENLKLMNVARLVGL